MLYLKNRTTFSNYKGEMYSEGCPHWRGIQPLYFGSLPVQLAALDSTHMMIHELMVQVFLNEDREAAVQALLLDPLTAAACSLSEIRQMFEEMAATQQAYLPFFINPR